MWCPLWTQYSLLLDEPFNQDCITAICKNQKNVITIHNLTSSEKATWRLLHPIGSRRLFSEAEVVEPGGVVLGERSRQLVFQNFTTICTLHWLAWLEGFDPTQSPQTSADDPQYHFGLSPFG